MKIQQQRYDVDPESGLPRRSAINSEQPSAEHQNSQPSQLISEFEVIKN